MEKGEPIRTWFVLALAGIAVSACDDRGIDVLSTVPADYSIDQTASCFCPYSGDQVEYSRNRIRLQTSSSFQTIRICHALSGVATEQSRDCSMRLHDGIHHTSLSLSQWIQRTGIRQDCLCVPRQTSPTRAFSLVLQISLSSGDVQ